MRLLFTWFIFVLLIHSMKGQNNQNIDLNINRDTLKGENTIYMFVNGQLSDSLVIGDMDYIKDSLVKINDTLWHYIYSIGSDKSHNMVTIRQVLIQELDRKIHFSFVSMYNFYFTPYVDDPHTYLSNYTYTLNLNDTNGYRIDMFHYKLRFVDDENSIDTIRTVVFLNYDVEKKIYYSSKDILDGEYYFSLQEPKKREYKIEDAIKVQLNNEEVMSIEIGKSHYIYFKDKWFIFAKYPRHTNIIALLPISSM